MDPPAEDVMQRPPRSPKESIMHGMVFFILASSLIQLVAEIGVFWYGLEVVGSVEKARTMVFLVACLFELVVVWNCRSERRNAFRVGFLTNKSLVIAVAISVLSTIAVVYIPPLPAIFQTVPLDLFEWTLVISLSSLGFLVLPEIFMRRNQKQKSRAICMHACVRLLKHVKIYIEMRRLNKSRIEDRFCTHATGVIRSVIERFRGFFRRVRSYLQITQMTPIARRYFIKNGFDGSMTVLGIVVGSWAVGVTNPSIIVTAGLGACLAMGVSGLFGAYMTERAERKNRIETLETAMLTDLSNSIQTDAASFASAYAALIDSGSPMLTGVISLVPFILTGIGLLAISVAYLVALILTLATLFSLGLYLGRIAKENVLKSGAQTVASGLLIVGLIFLFSSL